MKKILWAVLLVLVLVGGYFGIRHLTKPEPEQNVTIAQFGDLLLYLPVYIALDEGEFSRRGFDVTIVSTGGDDKTYAAVLGGSADFGVADPTFVAIAGERGARGYVVGLLINGMPNYGVTSNASAAEITDLADLKGKRFASVPAPSTAYAALAELYRRGGAEPNILQTSPAGLMAVDKQSGVYASILIEPWVSQLESNGGKVVLSMPRFFGEFALTGITTSAEMQRSRPETVRKVREAIMAGTRILYDDPETALKVARARFPNESPEALERGIARLRKDGVYPRDLRMTRAAWTAAIDLRRKSGDFEGDAEVSWAFVAPETR